MDHAQEPRRILDDVLRGQLLRESDEVEDRGIRYRLARGNTGAHYVACDERGDALAMYDANGFQVWPTSS